MSKVVFLFPGQGSQAVGMGADLVAHFPEARALFDKANEVLGFDLASLCFEGPTEELNQTINTQPALFVTSCSALASLKSRISIAPFAVAGHSAGEYAALVAAGSVSFADGLRLIRRRAELMQELAERRPGKMAAVIGAEADLVQECCKEASAVGVVSVANYNCPGQIVISGEAVGVERASEILKERGVKRIMPLNVSGAFHSALMAPAGDALYPELRAAGFKQARVPVVVNVTADYCKHGVDFAPYLTMQVSGSVRWEESMRRLLSDGAGPFVELGSGQVLAGLLKRIDKEATTYCVSDVATLEATLAALEGSNQSPGGEE